MPNLTSHAHIAIALRWFPSYRAIVVLLAALVGSGMLPSVLLAADVSGLVKEFETSLGKSAQAQEEAALNLLRRYSDYKKMVATGQVTKET